MAAVLFSPPSPATNLVEVRAVAGLPQAGSFAGGAATWRKFGVVVESDLADAEVRVATCSSPAPTFPANIGNTSGACGMPSGTGTDGGMGQQFRATLKLPRWYADAPLIDVTLRKWRSQARLTDKRELSSGSAAEVAVTHELGSFEAFYGYSTPLAWSVAQGAWQSGFAGLSWRPTPGTTLEFIVDRGKETATGTIDRTLTLRIAHAAKRVGIRFSAWATHALDDRADFMRAGIGLDYSF
jgi:hypothetical protein